MVTKTEWVEGYGQMTFQFSKNFLVIGRDKKVGKIGRKIAEKSFFGGPRKEKRMEISSARKIGGKSDLSAIYRFFTDISRFFW